MDMIGNLNLYIHNKKTGESLGYARIVTGTYRKTGALLVISMIPTALLGLTGKTAGSSGRRLSDCSGNRIFT